MGVFVLKRKKGQWAGTNSYNKTPQVPKDEKKNLIMLGNGLSMMLESELLSIGLIINFLDNGADQLQSLSFGLTINLRNN